MIREMGIEKILTYLDAKGAEPEATGRRPFDEMSICAIPSVLEQGL